MHSAPASGKIAFRHLGRASAELKAEFGDLPEEPDLENYLARTVPRYISKSELARLSPGDRAQLQIHRLDNTVAADVVPFALRARE